MGEGAFPGGLDFAAMALAAAAHHRRPAFNNFSQNVVERTDDVRGVGVAALFKFNGFSIVASRAIFRGDDDGNSVSIVVKGGRIARGRLMTDEAIH